MFRQGKLGGEDTWSSRWEGSDELPSIELPLPVSFTLFQSE